MFNIFRGEVKKEEIKYEKGIIFKENLKVLYNDDYHSCSSFKIMNNYLYLLIVFTCRKNNIIISLDEISIAANEEYIYLSLRDYISEYLGLNNDKKYDINQYKYKYYINRFVNRSELNKFEEVLNKYKEILIKDLYNMEAEDYDKAIEIFKNINEGGLEEYIQIKIKEMELEEIERKKNKLAEINIEKQRKREVDELLKKRTNEIENIFNEDIPEVELNKTKNKYFKIKEI